MSYAPASPDLSSLYSGAAPTQTTSTSVAQIGSTTSLASSSGRPMPLSPCAPSGLALPVSPAPTTGSRQPLYRQHQHQHHPQAGFPSQHLDAPRQPAYSPKSPVSPQPRPAHPHSHAPHPQQQHHAQYNLHSPHSPLPPRAPLQAAPPNYNTAHVGSEVQTQFYQPGGNQQLHYKLESPRTPPTYLAPLQTVTASGAFPTEAQPQGLEPPQVKAEYCFPPEIKDGNEMPPRRSAAAAVQQPAIMSSPVRTRFPTARIKRIMQADEEVGKVAQQTPIAVGKALELFMVALVSKSHDVARDKGAKRVTAQHLKQVVESDDQWDFLREIVGRVSETDDKAKAGGRAKAESSSDEEPAEAKKKGRGGRKKKAA